MYFTFILFRVRRADGIGLSNAILYCATVQRACPFRNYRISENRCEIGRVRRLAISPSVCFHSNFKPTDFAP